MGYLGGVGVWALLAAIARAGSDNLWVETYGPSVDLAFSGIVSFAHLPTYRCLDGPGKPFDIAILGAPFDTTVSYRPGARFGPYGIRSGSRRQSASRSYQIPWSANPYSDLSVVDCGDIPASPYDNALAMKQIEIGYDTVLARPVATPGLPAGAWTANVAFDRKEHPRIVTLGGDHTVLLPILRSLYKVYGPISVIHFDAHLDTWSGDQWVGAFTEQSKLTHGSFFWQAGKEGLIANGSSIHAGIRTRIASPADIDHDLSVGFRILTTEDIDEIGVKGIVKAIKKHVGDRPCYVSFDIDTVDPAFAPATGTPETGGWTTREVKTILRGLSGLNLVGMDVVEVAPAYDTQAELTQLLAADLVLEFLEILARTGRAAMPRPYLRAMTVQDAQEEGSPGKDSHDEL